MLKQLYTAKIGTGGVDFSIEEIGFYRNALTALQSASILRCLAWGSLARSPQSWADGAGFSTGVDLVALEHTAEFAREIVAASQSGGGGA